MEPPNKDTLGLGFCPFKKGCPLFRGYKCIQNKHLGLRTVSFRFCCVLYSKCPLLEVPLYGCSLVCISCVCLCSYSPHAHVCDGNLHHEDQKQCKRQYGEKWSKCLQSLPQGVDSAVLDSARVLRNNGESC